MLGTHLTEACEDLVKLGGGYQAIMILFVELERLFKLFITAGGGVWVGLSLEEGGKLLSGREKTVHSAGARAGRALPFISRDSLRGCSGLLRDSSLCRDCSRELAQRAVELLRGARSQPNLATVGARTRAERDDKTTGSSRGREKSRAGDRSSRSSRDEQPQGAARRAAAERVARNER
ncbi:Uncharacterized protein Fot_07683 [Forsythia ovata]|uniref:Uncharacterized protein n=1 Tax=Forsythia ovata TaxID=205694 RepID=A0ABD1WWM8_9LAMI